MAKNHFRDVDAFALVNLNRDAFSIVPDRDVVLFLVDVHLDHVHAIVPLKVVGSVYKNLVYHQLVHKQGQ